MEFILESQARAELRMEKAEARMEKTDKRIDSVAKLLQRGMRILVKFDTGLVELTQAQKRTDVRIAELARAQRELAQAQKATERSLKAFIDGMRHGQNGQNGRRS